MAQAPSQTKKGTLRSSFEEWRKFSSSFRNQIVSLEPRATNHCPNGRTLMVIHGTSQNPSSLNDIVMFIHFEHDIYFDTAKAETKWQLMFDDLSAKLKNEFASKYNLYILDKQQYLTETRYMLMNVNDKDFYYPAFLKSIANYQKTKCDSKLQINNAHDLKTHFEGKNSFDCTLFLITVADVRLFAHVLRSVEKR